MNSTSRSDLNLIDNSTSASIVQSFKFFMCKLLKASVFNFEFTNHFKI